ncbi:MAG: hypothetical protein AAF497_09115 [Planctomycetota bacterium]
MKNAKLQVIGFSVFTFTVLLACYVVIKSINDRRNYLERVLPLQKLTERVPQIPLKIGDWVGKPLPVDPSDVKDNCVGAIAWVEYRNTQTAQKIIVSLCGGTPRFVTRFPLLWNNNYFERQFKKELTHEQVSLANGEVAEVTTAQFFASYEKLTDHRRSCCYSEDGGWTSPRFAKSTFIGRPALAKVFFTKHH